MTSSASAQHPAAENARRITLGQVNQVRPKLPLLKILQAAGAQGETFTLKEVMHYLGQYIMVRQLYDKRQQHMVYCGGDQLGELLGLESFSVKDPSPVYDMLKRNLTSAAMADAAQNLAKEQSVDKPSQDQLKFSRQEGSDTGIMEGESNASALSTSEQKCENYEDKDLIENLSKSKKPKLDLVFEEWDVAGLPWWFLGNLRSNYKSRSNGSTDIQTNQDIDTAVVSDTTDDLWFLNECPSDQSSAAVKVETVDCEEVKEGDKKVTEDACVHDFEDSQCLSDDTDTEAASELSDVTRILCSDNWLLQKTSFGKSLAVGVVFSSKSNPVQCLLREQSAYEIHICRGGQGWEGEREGRVDQDVCNLDKPCRQGSVLLRSVRSQ
ncbi:protein Mdm4 isoform X3 [Calonectris borealis]|uniref:protein Mdm4 isoform X3 n=1 Tax=Calonectris borealis TaxID=1323832 RepID=UPI003F4B76C1